MLNESVAMAMLVLITVLQLLATFRNFWTFKSISLKRSGLPCFFSSSTFFGDQYIILIWMFKQCFLWGFWIWNYLLQQSFHSVKHIFQFCSIIFTRISHTTFTCFFLAWNYNMNRKTCKKTPCSMCHSTCRWAGGLLLKKLK